MLSTVNPCCRPYVLHNHLATLYCWSPAINCLRGVCYSDKSSPTVRASAGAFKHGSLTVDTLDRDGNVAIPVDLLCILPKLAKFLRGDFELRSTSQAIDEQAAVHIKAVEQAKQWLESLDDTCIGKQEFLEEWQQQHAHVCSDGSLKARWLSINTHTTAPFAARIRVNSPNLDAPFSFDSMPQNSQSIPVDNGVTNTGNGSLNATVKQVNNFPVPPGPLGAPPIDFSKAITPKALGLVCHTGLLPVHDGMSLDDAGVAFEVPMPHLNFCARNCDIAQGSWRSFLVLLSEDASFFESENLWPNFMQHQGRTLHNITCKRAVQFLADPCVSEIDKHVRNMAQRREGDRLEYLVQRWGKATLTELCQIHDKLGLQPSTSTTCAHAYGRQQDDVFGRPDWC